MSASSDRQPATRPFPMSALFIPVGLLVCWAAISVWTATARADVGPTPPDSPASSQVVPRPTSAARPTAGEPAGAPAAALSPAPAPVSALASTSIGRPLAPPPPQGTGCAAALAYLSANSAPGFQLVCPGYADGRQALTCVGQAPCAPNQSMIVIADPCPAAYMNEAHNSWVLLHDSQSVAIPGGNTAIDPYGHC